MARGSRTPVCDGAKELNDRRRAVSVHAQQQSHVHQQHGGMRNERAPRAAACLRRWLRRLRRRQTRQESRQEWTLARRRRQLNDPITPPHRGSSRQQRCGVVWPHALVERGWIEARVRCGTVLSAAEISLSLWLLSALCSHPRSPPPPCLPPPSPARIYRLLRAVPYPAKWPPPIRSPTSGWLCSEGLQTSASLRPLPTACCARYAPCPSTARRSRQR